MTPRPPARLAFAAAVTLALGLVPTGVEAGDGFERTKTCGSFGTGPCQPGERPKAIFWPGRCVKYQVNEEGTDDFPRSNNGTIDEDSRLYELVVEAFDRWNAPDCSDFTMVSGGLTSESDAEFNREGGNTNLVVWRDREWPYSSRTTFALTSVTFTTDGKIRDADMEFNTAVYDFTHVNNPGNPGESAKVDFLNTLMHEIGHFLGLDHPSDVEATMYAEANTGETKKRTLEQGDIRGLCTIYPTGDPPATCEEPSDFVGSGPSRTRRRGGSGACRSTPGAPPSPWPVAAWLIGFGFALHRGRQRWNADN